jgi:Cupin
VPRTLERNRPDLVSDRPRTYAAGVDILTDVLDRVRLKGTVIFHYEFGSPWSVALPRSADAIFHYLGRGSASIALEEGPMIQMGRRFHPHCPRRAPCPSFGPKDEAGPLADLDRWPAHVGVLPGVVDPGRMISCIRLHRATGADLNCQAVARVHPRVVCGAIRADDL